MRIRTTPYLCGNTLKTASHVAEHRAGIIHQIEQFGAALRDLAPALASFQQTLYHNGMSRDEATRCVQTVLRELCREKSHG